MLREDLPRILCVDDDSNLLGGLSRSLRSYFRVDTASDGKIAIERLQTSGPYAVIVSDQRMPGMDGTTLLSHARTLAPDTVRVLLTGQADVVSTIAAVNDGNIFRFLTKPCSTAELVKALAACVDQNRLILSERLLIEQTLRGSIKALVDILSLANPAAFGRATRVRHSVEQLMDHFQISERWPVEVAAMLSQIGYVTLPGATLEKHHRAVALSAAEQEMIDRMPAFVDKCLSNIPRLEPVREILRLYPRNFAGKWNGDLSAESELPWGARALRVAIDCDLLESKESPVEYPVAVMRSRANWYDPEILESFAVLHGESKDVKIVELKVRELMMGMMFAEDLKSPSGLLLVARGQEVTAGLLECLRNIPADIANRQIVRMIPVRSSAKAALTGSDR